MLNAECTIEQSTIYYIKTVLFIILYTQLDQILTTTMTSKLSPPLIVPLTSKYVLVFKFKLFGLRLNSASEWLQTSGKKVTVCG